MFRQSAADPSVSGEALVTSTGYRHQWQGARPNARAHDDFYQALISQVKIFNITSLLSMEEIKSTTALPL